MFMYLLKTAKDFIYIRKKIRQTYLLTIWSEKHGTKTIKAKKNVDLNNQIATLPTAKKENQRNC